MSNDVRSDIIDVVEVYRNLDGSYSLRRPNPPSLERDDVVLLKHVEFVINQPAQSAARTSGVRSAHAFARGELVREMHMPEWLEIISEAVDVSYHHDRGFYRTDTGEVISGARWLAMGLDYTKAVL